MKKILLFIFLICPCFQAFSQDYLITNNGEKRSCVIKQISAKYIFYALPGAAPQSRDSISIENISSYYSATPIEELIFPERKGHTFKDRWEFSLSPGVGYLLSKKTKVTSDQVREFLNASHYGISVNGDAAWFVTNHFGVGITGSYFFSFKRDDIVGLLSDSSTYVGPLTNKMGLSYIGAGGHYRIKSANTDNAYEIKMTAGYLNYQDVVSMRTENKVYSGDAFAASLSIIFDFYRNKKAGLRTGLSFTYCVMDNYTSDSFGNNTQPDFQNHDVDLSRLDVFIGIRL